MLIIGRAVAGIGSSGLMNGGLTILSMAMPLHKRPKYFGIMMGFAQMGTILGPIIGGAFTTYVNWRWCTFPFLLYNKIFILILTIGKAFISISPSAASRV
jgi:MFS family permease